MHCLVASVHRDAVRVVAHFATFFVHQFDQAVDIGLKTWAELGELTCKDEVVHDLLIEDFARNQQRNAGWVRRDQTHGNAAFQVVDLHTLGLAARDVRKRVRRLHRWRQVRQIHLRGQTGDVVLGVELVHVLAQVLQAHALIALVLLAELGKDAPHRLVLLVVVLELLQRGQHRVPAALGDADGEHDEERVQTGLLDHHAVLGQVLGDDGRGDASLVKVAVQVQPGRHDGGLDRVQHVEAIGQIAKAVPVVELLAVLALGLARCIRATNDPVLGRAHALVGQGFGAPDLEPPVVLAKFLVHLAHRTAEVQRLQDRLLHQRGAAGRLHHRGGHIAAGDDAVLRAGRGVHQVRLVEQVEVQLLGLAVLHQHVRCLADTGQQLVDGLGGIHHRVLRACALLAHGVVAAIEGVEGRMWQPGFVKVQVVDIAIELLLDGLGVVEHAVVGRLRQGQHTGLDRFWIDSLEQRVRSNLGLDGLGRELALVDRADDAEVVARGLQEHRNRTRHDDGVQDGLVAVAVHHHHIARRHRVVPNHLVRGRGTVGHKEAVVGIEDACRIALALTNRAVVVQQLAQLFHSVADVGAQHVLAIELVVHLANRALQESHTATVTGAVPAVGAVFGVIQQRLEERWLNAFEVVLGFAQDVLGHELGRVLEHVDEAVQLTQDVVGQVAAGLGFAVDVDRHIRILAAHFGDEVTQVVHDLVITAAQLKLLVIDRQDEGTGAALLLRKLAQVTIAGHAQHLKALLLDGMRQIADAQAGSVFRAKVLVNDDDGKAKLHGRSRSRGPQ